MKRKSLFITFTTMVVLALLLTACNTASAGTKVALAAQIPEITIKAADFSFDAPAQIEAGLVKIKLVNDGQEPHHAQIVRLNDGVTLEQFQAALQEGEAAAFPLVAFVGGPGLVDPGLMLLDAGEFGRGERGDDLEERRAVVLGHLLDRLDLVHTLELAVRHASGNTGCHRVAPSVSLRAVSSPYK